MKTIERGVSRRFLYLALLMFFLFSAGPLWAARGDEPRLGVYEGWSWPVVVIQPPEGWDSAVGEAVKYGLRTAEREISLQREGIKGFEVTFMFSSISGTSELIERMDTWRRMNAGVIISFAGQDINEDLMRLCAVNGPSVIFAGGEDLAIKNPLDGRPYPYLFALDLTYFARANALSEFAIMEAPLEPVTVITDRLSLKLAKGAEQNSEILQRKGVDVLTYFVPGAALNQFDAQVQEAVSSGAGVITSWLDSMATLSIWRTASRGRSGIAVYYSGEKQRLLLDADGLVIVDKDDVLNRNEEGKRVISMKVRDDFNVVLKDPVTAAKAFAIGKWAIHAFSKVTQPEQALLALELSRADDIPLMDETLSINPRTNRPLSRKYGVLRVRERNYVPVASVDVYSAEVAE